MDELSSVSHNIYCHPWIKQTNPKHLHLQSQRSSRLFQYLKCTLSSVKASPFPCSGPLGLGSPQWVPLSHFLSLLCFSWHPGLWLLTPSDGAQGQPASEVTAQSDVVGAAWIGTGFLWAFAGLTEISLTGTLQLHSPGQDKAPLWLVASISNRLQLTRS